MKKVRWRGPSEISFRLRQEALNLALLARPPRLPKGARPRAPFPAPESFIRSLRSTTYAETIINYADKILGHQFPILGIEIDTGPEIRWRRDYVSGKETGTEYFRSIPYLNAAIAGDHKIIWELNRHQHLVLLAQAYGLTEERRYLAEIEAQLDGWLKANPVQHGINWASALEVAFRALSWTWVDHLVGKNLDEVLRARMLEGLYQHASHLEANLSVYFSPNTHLLGEAVTLHALGLMFHGIEPAAKWERTGARIVSEEIQKQVRADGSYFEQSSYYHVYALDMFLFHATLSKPDEIYCRCLEKMALYLEALIGPSRTLPFLGDDDGGRFFHPYGRRDRFARATLAACGQFFQRPEWIQSQDKLRDDDLREIAVWWLGPYEGAVRSGAQAPADSELFTDAGLAVVTRSESAHCIVDAGPFGPFRGGHSHSDTLSIVASASGQPLLIDPGTYTYASDSEWRNRFRGTAAHNTVRIGGLDQADPAGPFGWREPPRVEILEWRTERSTVFLDAACSYRGFRHRRRVLFVKPQLMFVLDEIEGAQIEAEQFWHPGDAVSVSVPGCFRIGRAGMLIVDTTGGEPELSQGGDFGWRSDAYGSKAPSSVIVSRRTGNGVVQFGAMLAFSVSAGDDRLAIAPAGDQLEMHVTGGWNLVARFPASGMPRLAGA